MHCQALVINPKGTRAIVSGGGAACRPQSLERGQGPKSIGLDFRDSLRVRVYADAPATIGLSHRAGFGSPGHIETNELRIQDAVERREFELYEIGGEHNPEFSVLEAGASLCHGQACGYSRILHRSLGSSPLKARSEGDVSTGVDFHMPILPPQRHRMCLCIAVGERR